MGDKKISSHPQGLEPWLIFISTLPDAVLMNVDFPAPVTPNTAIETLAFFTGGILDLSATVVFDWGAPRAP